MQLLATGDRLNLGAYLSYVRAGQRGHLRVAWTWRPVASSQRRRLCPLRRRSLTDGDMTI